MKLTDTSCLGIGVITHNRLSVLQRCVSEIARHTRVPYSLVIADDGSSDGTAAWARGRGIPVVTGFRRGIAWNKNRALYCFQQHTDCDPILLFEDDTWPIKKGWDTVWVAAALRWQHVNYCYGFDRRNPPRGAGTEEDPFQCPAFGGHCTITTKRALGEVGFLDPRFVGYGWEHVEWTHRFRLRYGEDWGIPEGMLPCLDYGVRATWPKSFSNQQEWEHNGEIYTAIRSEIVGPYYSACWRHDAERLQLEQEISNALVSLVG
jgi:glycosyltransferase involved in cell wall biosynthesis